MKKLDGQASCRQSGNVVRRVPQVAEQASKLRLVFIYDEEHQIGTGQPANTLVADARGTIYGLDDQDAAALDRSLFGALV
jgi:hypothetical protein